MTDIAFRTALTDTIEAAIARTKAAQAADCRVDAGPDSPEARANEACWADLRELERRIPKPPTGIGDIFDRARLAQFYADKGADDETLDGLDSDAVGSVGPTGCSRRSCS
jgi:hypothetical protein